MIDPVEPVEPVESAGPPASAEAASATSQSLERGLTLLTMLAERRGPTGLVQLARDAGLSKSTTHRCIATLVARGFVEQDPVTRKYDLGPSAIGLGFAALSSLELTRISAPRLQALADETGQTANMAVLDGADIVYVDRRRPTRGGFRVELNVQVGARLPAYCTSMGKVLLANRDASSIKTILDRTDLARRGPKTITAREQLMAELYRVAETGLAVNDEELAPGLRSLAAPVRDRSGSVVAAVNLSIHMTAWNASMEAVVRKLETPLRRTAGDISHRLGYVPGVRS